jgi:hypothetical protein
LEKPFREKIGLELKKSFPALQVIDSAMKISAIKDAVWATFGMNTSVPYPTFREQLLFGVLSSAVHRPEYGNIPVSDLADLAYREFFEELGKVFGRQVIMFSDVDASTGEDLDKIA